jgi:hypothetical protein
MSDASTSGLFEEFSDKARREADRVVGELTRLRFDAQQVSRVLKALALPVPDEIASFLGTRGPVVSPPATASLQPPVSRTGSDAHATAPSVTPRDGGDAAPTVRDVTTRKRRGPAHPGIEAVPEELRAMPSAQGRGPLNGRISAATAQKRVYDYIREHPGMLAAEIARELEPDNVEAIERHVTRLQQGENPLVVKNGKRRLPKWSSPGRGRVGHEVVARDVVSDPQTAARPNEAKPAAKPSNETPPSDSSPDIARREPETPGSTDDAGPERVSGAVAQVKVRDWFAANKSHQTGAYTVDQVADSLGLDKAITQFCLDLFVDREHPMLTRTHEKGVVRYSYVPITPIERRVVSGSDTPVRTNAPVGRGVPVPGTGKRSPIPNDDVRELVEDIRKAGGDVRPANTGHYQVLDANGKPFPALQIASSPAGAGRTPQNDRARVRKVLPIP